MLRRSFLTGRARRPVAAGTAALMTVVLGGTLWASAGTAVAAPVGNGFTVTPADLAFILKQVKIAEHHSKAVTDPTFTPANPSPLTDPNYCQALVGPGPDQIPDRLTSYGLRTVDGSCNNLFPGRDKFAASDMVFPRLTTAVFRDAEPIPAALPVGVVGSATSYKQLSGAVIDSQPRLISNLIVDQTSTNPAAIAAAGFPVRAQAGATGVVPCSDPPAPLTDPVGCVPAHGTLFMENVTTDVGLSPPFNSMFTFFGQFFRSKSVV